MRNTKRSRQDLNENQAKKETRRVMGLRERKRERERERETRSRKAMVVRERGRSGYLSRGCPNMVSKRVSRSRRLTPKHMVYTVWEYWIKIIYLYITSIDYRWLGWSLRQRL